MTLDELNQLPNELRNQIFMEFMDQDDIEGLEEFLKEKY